MATIKSIDSKTAQKWLANGEAVLVDVREKSEHTEVCIRDAHLIPVDKISVEKLPEAAKNKKIIVHCKLGGRSQKACAKLLAEDVDLDLYNLEGGIEAWEAAGLPVAKS